MRLTPEWLSKYSPRCWDRVRAELGRRKTSVEERARMAGRQAQGVEATAASQRQVRIPLGFAVEPEKLERAHHTPQLRDAAGAARQRFHTSRLSVVEVSATNGWVFWRLSDLATGEEIQLAALREKVGEAMRSSRAAFSPSLASHEGGKADSRPLARKALDPTMPCIGCALIADSSVSPRRPPRLCRHGSGDGSHLENSN